MSVATARLREYELADRFRPTARAVLLGGIPAVGRLIVEQRERDARAGLRTGTFVSGYPGSPLGGVDLMLASTPELRALPDLAHVPGVNEELAATAIWGSQLPLPGREPPRDGTVGIWYGKSPGVDRSGDAFRTANLHGAHPRGGVVVLAGDDPAPKSSTVPSASEATLASFGVPVLVPRNAEEVVEHGLLAVALSRASGCWVALKIVTDVADGAWSVARDFAARPIIVPELEWEGRPWSYGQATRPGLAEAMAAERELVGPRWEMVLSFARANLIDVVDVGPRNAWLGIVAAGKAFDDTRQALLDLGLDEPELEARGIRLLRIGMVSPLEPEGLRDFARDVDVVLVVEEKKPFLETQVKSALYGLSRAPLVLGKCDAEQRPLVPADGELTAARLAPALHRVLAPRVEVREPTTVPASLPVLSVQRTAYFCSGCPHNRSTVHPADSLAGGGIGCHGLVGGMERGESAVTGLTQMGGEGAQWIGQWFAYDGGHLFQNIGDGTFFHSGQLAVQACVAAGVNVTFKLLYNSTVAMTGGQDAAGAVPAADLTRKLEAEGIARTIVCTDEPSRYRSVTVAANAEVWHRDRLDEAQLVLRDVPGVTVLLYDQQCAAQARRLRKRGKLPQRTMRVVINEDVCEGCGDCGRKSNCLSVQPVETELGTKRRIDQTSCNTDYSCLLGDCPSFVTVESGPLHEHRAAAPAAPAAPEPPRRALASTFNVFLAGVGGTGVVTVNQILATAALLDGLHVRTLDQTGISQKAGPVVSHLRIGRSRIEPSNRIGVGQTDCYLALDVLTGGEARNLAYADRGRTAAFVSTTEVPTGAIVEGSTGARFPARDVLLERIRSRSRSTLDVDTFAAASRLFGHTTPAHFLLVGIAYQAGELPVSAEAIEHAIELNGVGAADNVAAFRWGRAVVADPAAYAAATARVPRPARPVHPLPGSPLTGSTREAAAVRAAALDAYGGERLVGRYLEAVEAAWHAERSVTTRTDFSRAVAAGLHRVLAVKDEYEVARLLTEPGFTAFVEAEVPGAHRLRYRLHPPLLRSLGLRRKIALGPAWRPFLVLLARLRFLRGTPFDPFGRARVRRVEARLARDYAELVSRLAATLDAEGYDRAVAAAEAVELVRGYEEVKLAGLDRYRQRLAELGFDG